MFVVLVIMFIVFDLSFLLQSVLGFLLLFLLRFILFTRMTHMGLLSVNTDDQWAKNTTDSPIRQDLDQPFSEWKIGPFEYLHWIIMPPARRLQLPRPYLKQGNRRFGHRGGQRRLFSSLWLPVALYGSIRAGLL